MALSHQQIEELYDRYLNNQCTPEELQALINELGEDSPDFQEEKWTKLFDKTWDGLKAEPGKYMIKPLHLSKNKVNKIIPMPSKRRSIYAISAAVAAIFLAVIGTGVYFYFNDHSSKIHMPELAKQVVSPILPGGNRAVLTLANGKKIDLNEANNGEISKVGNISITKQKNGELIYVTSADHSADKNEIAFNTIATPNGGQYKIVLPDGTKVWLNAASSLTYPTTFKGNERHVELNGEAYFEVVENKVKPFKVSANNVNIKVLGTHFNVMAYKDEAQVNTTLLEGSVMLNTKNKRAILVPGQQGSVQKNSTEITLKAVDVNDAIAWKNKYFHFGNENIKTAMKKIARWYDVDIEYVGDMRNKTLGGAVSRSENISELLSIVELTGLINFKIEGRKIIVTAKP